jgi:hypothetical protein
VHPLNIFNWFVVYNLPDFMLYQQLSIYPLEIIRTRLTLCSNGTYRGMGDAAIKIYRQEGAMAFYRGLIPSLVMRTPKLSSGHLQY